MVFHQFIGGPRPRLQIYVNGSDERSRLRAWDPFLEKHLATFTPSDAETIRFSAGNITAKGFVLPHKDKLAEQEYVAAAGPSGWNAQQGFYVYRNKRLLVPGGWLDLGYTNDEHYELARIRVEIPNSSDQAWAIDVKKSRARPPAAIRRRLKELADIVRGQARQVFLHRGQRSSSDGGDPVRRIWMTERRKERLFHRIDREHPLTKLTLSMATTKAHRSHVESLLRLVEATVPIQQIRCTRRKSPAPMLHLSSANHQAHSYQC